ncbi:MAG: bifunctional phosphopantothenoylcysteine decarboxylase/phosphopantothenate--cysteine ligase CoaBC [Synergistetes bacterium]|nr:bifunctional phosphopantothenoylcysteine decarboxylase/phosphopantothenate--cysteine ligase CoaBC [Synergistota bacterium]MCX8127513.1 bifunctional phosphopantothenoylcysteine decarboxylase/phosphopantothenate--cysteine ligase CoaBC [Synergistota bacterium]MDW8191570.1 bifunctional phosphopantothenoylcysteine decarboxylase/phosphopantothenate--cysteine ligase CoaBC [Synergistota bacterium]
MGDAFKSFLQGKNIILGVTGSISAYKSVEFLRLLQDGGANVKVILSEGATEFITPLSFSPFAKEVYSPSDYFAGGVPHIELASWGELLIVYPASADFISSVAFGRADGLLETVYMAFRGPKILAPAMNWRMYESSSLRRALKLIKDEAIILEPEEGFLACGESGKGRLVSPETAFYIAEKTLYEPKILTGLKVLVTAGPTREWIDPVRFISNPSSGKMGYSVAYVASLMGAYVYLVSGPVNLTPPPDVKLYKVEAACEMFEACLEIFPNVHIAVKSAAVSDFKPVSTSSSKIKKEGLSGLVVELSKNPDILLELGKIKKNGQVLVGFALETEDVFANAYKKLKEKNADFIVVNEASIGFAGEENEVAFVYPSGVVRFLPRLHKKKVAEEILKEANGIRTGCCR